MSSFVSVASVDIGEQNSLVIVLNSSLSFYSSEQAKSNICFSKGYKGIESLSLRKINPGYTNSLLLCYMDPICKKYIRKLGNDLISKLPYHTNPFKLLLHSILRLSSSYCNYQDLFLPHFFSCHCFPLLHSLAVPK